MKGSVSRKRKKQKEEAIDGCPDCPHKVHKPTQPEWEDESVYKIKCSDGYHNTFWKTVVESPQWKAWEKESNRRFSLSTKGLKIGGEIDTSHGLFFDVDECRECGWISPEHFNEFLRFTSARKEQPQEREIVPCDSCIKGGYQLTPEGGERLCPKCGGWQWVEIPPKNKIPRKSRQGLEEDI